MKSIRQLLAMGLLAFSSASHAAITGTVFSDGNGNGVKDPGDSGLPEIIVNAYDASNTLVQSVVSSADGTYTLASTNGGTNYRVEFVIPSNGCGVTSNVDYSALGGGSYGTEVQFVDGADTGVNYGVLDPSAYVTQANPVMYSIVYSNGDPLPAGSSGDAHAVVGFNYNDVGIASNPSPGPAGTGDPYDVIATQRNLGATGGMAVSKQANRIFVSAVLKRHVGLGKDGSGAIYMLDPTNPPAANTQLDSFVNLDALGIATQGAGAYSATPTGFHDVIGTNSERGLNTDKTQPSLDDSAFGQVGRVSLGDVDISEDGQYLYVTNLYDRKLYRIDLQDANSPVQPTAAQVHAFDNTPWLNLSCPNGIARPYGTKFYRGQIYVGVVCTGENGTTTSPINFNNSSTYRDADDLRAYIYALPHNAASAGDGSAASIAYEFPLNYRKSYHTASMVRGWYRWSDDANLALSGREAATGNNLSLPQPILSDIEFDNDGSMILGFMDRGGHQWGDVNYVPGDTNSLAAYTLGGDLLRVYKDASNGCQYTLETNGVAGPNTSTQIVNGFVSGVGEANGSGNSFTDYTYTDINAPNGKEFYWGDYAIINNGNIAHSEATMGTLAFWPSSGSILVSAMDPVDGFVDSGGVNKLSNITGEKVEGYNLFDSRAEPGAFAKANGLGDVEIMLEEPPLEIGNRIWCDSNEDGIQTADENTAPSGVSVTLTCGAESATTTTNASGGYYFNDTNWVTSANTTSLEIPRDSSCVVSIDVSGANETAISNACGGSILTALNQSSGIVGATQLTDDVRDSDGTIAGTIVSTAAFTTGQDGQSNHSYDFGFRATPTSGSITIIKDATPNDPQDFAFTATGAGTSNFSLDDDSDATLSNTQVFSNLADGAFSFTEAAIANWSLTGVSCTGATNSTVTTNATGVDITLNNAEDIVCTFYNNTHTCPAGQINNIASITSNESETSYANNSDNACVDITAACSLTASAVVSSCTNVGNDSDPSNDTFTFDLTVQGSNTGGSTSYNYLSNSANVSGSGTYSATAETDGAFIISSTTTPFDLTITDAVDNTCSTTVTGLIAPAVCSNSPQVDLELVKTVDVTTVISGDTVTYTLTLRNNGPDDATGVAVSDQLPLGVSYQSDDGAGTYNSVSGIWTVGSLANGAVTTLNVVVTVD